MIKKYGLIGYPLSHTFSPSYFGKKFERENISAEYLAYELEQVEQFVGLFESGLSGLNVTIPYKEKVLPFLDVIDEASLAIGAVNTIKNIEGKLHGYNTDVYGFEKSLLGLKLPFDISNSKSLVMGTGGASKAIQYVLNSLGSHCVKVSRNLTTGADITYATFRNDSIKEYDILVNTTPLGMYPKVEESPAIPYWELSSKHLVYDLIYNPEKTLLLKRAEERGSVIKNGSEMLVLQAEKSWEIWNTK